MNAYRSADRLLVGLAVVVLGSAVVLGATGCAGGSAGANSPAPTTSATTASTPAPTSSPADSSERAMFTGTAVFALPDGADGTTEGPFTTYEARVAVTYRTTDPRASGTLTGVLTMISVDMPDGFTVNKWFYQGDCDDLVITNAGGSWRCTETFGADMWDPAGGIHTVFTDAYMGEGGYAGLRMRLFGAQGTSEPADATAEFVVYGWLEPVA